MTEPCDFRVSVSQTLSRSAKVKTDDYIPYKEWDDSTNKYVTELDTKETNWKAAFENNHYTIPELLSKFKAFLEEKKKSKKVGETRHIDYLIEECSAWEVDEYEVVED